MYKRYKLSFRIRYIVSIMLDDFKNFVEFMDQKANNENQNEREPDVCALFDTQERLFQPRIKFLDPMTQFKNHKYIFTLQHKIDTLQDLIDLSDKVGNNTKHEYSIDVKTLVNIKSSLLKLNNFIGIKDIKKDILHQILYYLQRMNSKDDYMHIVISGPPGCGKTELAKTIGEIFSKMNVLKNNSFKKVVRSDLIAGYLGQTALKTRELVEKNLGGVLFIDEAYSLGHREKGDSFAKECIDTLNESLSDHKDELMVIIAGYKQELDETFFRMNPGLRSRFPWTYHIDNYDHTELCEMFNKKADALSYVKSPSEKYVIHKWHLNVEHDALLSWFKSNYKDFKSYGRDIDVFLSSVKIAHSKRVFMCPQDKYYIKMEDIIEGKKLFQRGKEKKDDFRYAFDMYT